MGLVFFSVFIYVFFVYGIIEFTKNIYFDFVDKQRMTKNKRIKILINDKDDIEYDVRMLKKYFDYIEIVAEKDTEEIKKVIESLSREINLEYTTYLDTMKSDNSDEE